MTDHDLLDAIAKGVIAVGGLAVSYFVKGLVEKAKELRSVLDKQSDALTGLKGEVSLLTFQVAQQAQTLQRMSTGYDTILIEVSKVAKLEKDLNALWAEHRKTLNMRN